MESKTIQSYSGFKVFSKTNNEENKPRGIEGSEKTSLDSATFRIRSLRIWSTSSLVWVA